MKKHTMEIYVKLAAATLAVAGTGVYLVGPGKATEEQKAPFQKKNFAHRGLHTEDKSVPENSMEAFRLAAEQRYGIELDVQLSKDGEVVVFHDATLNRVCGVDSRVDAKNYAELKTLGLAGSDQTIPLFSEVLKCIDGRGPLLVELKTGPKNRELCRKTMDLLSKYEGQYCIESFDPRIVMWFRFHAPKVFRGQLACRPRDYEPEDASRPVAFILGNCLMDFLGRPQFISYKVGKKTLAVKLAVAMGAMTFGWTSHDKKDMKKNDAVIFEFYTPEKI